MRVAAHFATLPRDDDEGAGAILVFDRSSLNTRYKLECIDNVGRPMLPSSTNSGGPSTTNSKSTCLLVMW